MIQIRSMNPWSTKRQPADLMDEVIEKLACWKEELEKVVDFPSVEEKALHIGLLNRIDTAIGQLRLCESFEIFRTARVCEVPLVADSSDQPEIRLVNDHESDEPRNLQELQVDGKPLIRLIGGELIIRR